MKQLLIAVALVMAMASTALAQRCNNGQCSDFNRAQAQQQALPAAQPALNFQLPEKVPPAPLMDGKDEEREQKAKKTSVESDADLEDAQLVRRVKAKKITLDVGAMAEIARPRGVDAVRFGTTQVASTKMPASMFKKRR